MAAQQSYVCSLGISGEIGQRVKLDNTRLATQNEMLVAHQLANQGSIELALCSVSGIFCPIPAIPAPSEEVQPVKRFPAHVMDEATSVKPGVGGNRLPGY